MNEMGLSDRARRRVENAFWEAVPSPDFKYDPYRESHRYTNGSGWETAARNRIAYHFSKDDPTYKRAQKARETLTAEKNALEAELTAYVEQRLLQFETEHKDDLEIAGWVYKIEPLVMLPRPLSRLENDLELRARAYVDKCYDTWRAYDSMLNDLCTDIEIQPASPKKLATRLEQCKKEWKQKRKEIEKEYVEYIKNADSAYRQFRCTYTERAAQRAEAALKERLLHDEEPMDRRKGDLL